MFPVEGGSGIEDVCLNAKIHHGITESTQKFNYPFFGSPCPRGEETGLRNRAQEYVRRSVIRERLADVNEVVYVSRTKNETASELERIFSQFVLAMTGSFRALASQAIYVPEQMK